jgi:hypothetical protein
MNYIRKSRSWQKVLFGIFIALTSISIIGWTIYSQGDNKRKAAFDSSIIGFLTGLLSSGFVVSVGVKSIKEHVNDIKKEDYRELHKFWKNELNQSKDNSKYTIVLILDDGHVAMNSLSESSIGIAKSLACFKICNVLTNIHEKNISIDIKVIDGENQINEEILEGNLIFIGCGSTASTFRTVTKLLDLPHYHREPDNKGNYFSISNSNFTQKYQPALHEISKTHPSDDTTVVTRIATDKQLIVIYNSHYSQGVLGGVVITTTQDKLKELDFFNSVKKQSSNLNQPYDISHLVAFVRCSRDRRIDCLSYQKDLGLGFTFPQHFRQEEISGIYDKVQRLKNKMIN